MGEAALWLMARRLYPGSSGPARAMAFEARAMESVVVGRQSDDRVGGQTGDRVGGQSGDLLGGQIDDGAQSQ